MSEKIKSIYENVKPPAPIIPFLLFLVVISLLGTLYASVQRKILHQEEEEDPCNPRYVFFSGLLNPFQKDPWGETEKKFKRCISTHMYRDPAYSKTIHQNRINIQDREKEIQSTIQSRSVDLSDAHEKWVNIKTNSTQGIEEKDATIDAMFTSQYTLHEEMTKNMVQLYYIVDAILKYIYTAIKVRLSKEKLTLSIDDRHEQYMEQYKAIYGEYSEAIQQYKAGKYSIASQKSQSAIERFDALKEEIRLFRADHQQSRQYIQRGCYRMKEVFDEPGHCEKIFPLYKKDALAWGYNID